MTETQAEKMIPNAVGRLDPVIDAIRAENWVDADDLCQSELVRRGNDILKLEEELKKKRQEYDAVEKFMCGMWVPVNREKILAEARN